MTRSRSPPRSVRRAEKTDKPWLIACRTTIGFGAPTRAGTVQGAWRGARTRGKSPARAKNLGLALRAFRHPEPKSLPNGARSPHAAPQRMRKWNERAGRLRQGARTSSPGFWRAFRRRSTPRLKRPERRSRSTEKPKIATRKASEIALAAINGATDLTIGGSADLTHSNLTITKGMEPIRPDDFSRPLHPLRHPRTSAWPRR